MTRHSPAATRRWQAALIVSGFVVAVAGAALAGWWYARESSPHQGPIVLISLDGIPRGALPAAGEGGSASPSISALAAEAVVFDRAYTHSPLTLPAHASLLAGQLPFEHGVRDEAGFTLNEGTRSLAELLRNRGFETGAAVSSFLLRRESGVAQGFSFFDAELPETPPDAAPAVERDGAETMDAAVKWLRSRQGNRYFLFVQVNDAAAEATVAQVVAELKERGLYEQATIVLTADHAGAGTDVSLDEASLQVPLLVKQPDGEGAGRHVAMPVQHIDILPTILDLVRAPVPSGLRGRSLRALLGDDVTTLPDQLFYAEALAGQFRFGAPGRFTLASPRYRYIRGDREELVGLESETSSSAPATLEDTARLRAELDRLLEGRAVGAPAQIASADEERLAALGYLGGPPLLGSALTPIAPEEEAAVAQMHRSAALLVARRQYAMAIDRLRDIARAHPLLAAVQYQAGVLLLSTGRLAEAETTFRAVATIEPDSAYIQSALADVLLRTGRDEDASDRAALAVALAEHQDGRARAAAHGMAAIVALARGEGDRARAYAEAVEQDDPGIPMASFIAGRLEHAEGQYEEALASFEAAARTLGQNERTLEGLHWYLGDTLARLDRVADAEKAFREELRAFPRHIPAYSSLATLYHASGRPDAVKETLDALVVAAPTPEGYDAAARMWVIVGDPTYAAALRTDASTRFRGDPSLALFQRRR
jgi:tetratricopeptide (TPR) repeat protein